MASYWGHSMSDKSAIQTSLESFHKTFSEQEVERINRELMPYLEEMGYAERFTRSFSGLSRGI